MTSDYRFTRQVRLAEVGEEGQARLSGAVVRARGPSTELPGRVEARYLRGAGVTVTDDANLHAPSVSGPDWLASLAPGAREVAAGAYAALDVVRAILDATPHARVESA